MAATRRHDPLGTALGRAMAFRRMTVQELSIISGVHERTIVEYRRGAPILSEHMPAIAGALNIPANRLRAVAGVSATLRAAEASRESSAASGASRASAATTGLVGLNQRLRGRR